MEDDFSESLEQFQEWWDQVEPLGWLDLQDASADDLKTLEDPPEEWDDLALSVWTEIGAPNQELVREGFHAMGDIPQLAMVDQGSNFWQTRGFYLVGSSTPYTEIPSSAWRECSQCLEDEPEYDCAVCGGNFRYEIFFRSELFNRGQECVLISSLREFIDSLE